MSKLSSNVIGVNLPTNFRERRRTLKSGKVKATITMEIKSDPIIANYGNRDLGKEPAEALAAEIVKRIVAVQKPVSPSTVARRNAYAAAFARGDRGALKRYGGGRTPAAPPTPDGAYGNDSGRITKITVRHNPTKGTSDQSWTINVPANRLKKETFGPGFDAFLHEFRRLVDIPGAARSREFERALLVSVNDLLGTAQANLLKKKRALRQLQMRLVGNAVKAILG